MNNTLNHGSLVISLDFEMMWGCHDWTTPDEYGATNISHVPEVIDRMLLLFNKYGIHATFATVGLILCGNKENINYYLPELKPAYKDKNCSPYKDTYIADINDKDLCLYFAPDVIGKLKSSHNIEIGTHTFCHYFCWEKGQTIEQFKSDLLSAKTVTNDNGLLMKSIVFPKNEVSGDYLTVCREMGIESYRGNAKKYFSEPKTKWQSIKNKICRLLDAYINIGGMSGIQYNEIDIKELPINLRASRMLRPYSPRLSFLDGLRFNRMKREMIDAAKNNKMYHIWWHPHNFGANMEENLAFLEKILQCYYDCHVKYNMQSYTMNEMRDILVSNSNV